MTYLLGLDNGGTVCKAALFDLDGCEVAVFSEQSPVHTPKPGYTERDMEALWLTNCACIKGVLEKSGIAPEKVLGLAVGGHGKGLYAWGKDGKPAYNGIVSTDNRAWRYPENWKKSGVFDSLYPQLCQQLLPCQQASILAWMKDHDRAVYDNIQWVFSVKDYIRFRLTDEAYYEVTDLSSSGLMDVKNNKVDPHLLSALGIGEVYEKLAPQRYSSEICGAVTKEAAALTGLIAGTPVAAGMFDIDACAIAMDITNNENICTITGTWSINEFISKTPVVGTQIAMNSLYAIPGYYLIEECSATGAGNLEWMIENLIGGISVPEGKSLYDHINELVDSIEPQNSDVFYLPFLYGSNAHPLAKAGFIGLTSYHTLLDMLRAVYEGVAYSAKSHIDKLLSVREPPQAIRMGGGAVRSPLWVQMFADVLGLPIETVTGVNELGALGCAMSAAVSVGIYKDYSEAAGHMVRISPPVYPDEKKSLIYAEKYRKYNAVKSALDRVWGEFEV